MSAGYDWKRIFEPKSWKITTNVLIICIVVALVGFGGYSLYRYFFPKKLSQTQTIHMAQGSGAVTITNIAERKRFFIPFIEGGAEAKSKENIGAFIRAGLRFEF